MEEKKMRELSMDEMDKVSGGDIKDSLYYWVKDHPCPKCGENRVACLRLEFHDYSYAQIECIKCGEKFDVIK